jgi:hypothetical protein
MTFLKTLILFLFSFNLEAQVEAILKDSNIVWAAELELDFKVDKTSDSLSNKLNNIALIKLLRREVLEDTNEDYFLSEHILATAKEGALPIFTDSNLTNHLNYMPVKSIDTIIPIDPPHYRNSRIISISPYRIENIKLFRARQLVYYDSSKTLWNMKTKAVAPLVKEDDSTNIYKPLFWISVENEKPNIASDDIVWAKRLTTLSNNTLTFNKANILKMTDNVPMQHFLKQVLKNYDIPLYESLRCSDEDRLSTQQREALLTRNDTVVKINPATYEMSIKTNTFKVDGKDVKKLKLVQEWYWNDNKKQLIINLITTAPLIELKDDNGNFSHDSPLFYCKTRYD